MAGQDKRFVSPNDVETQVFNWGTIKWLSEPRVTNAERFSAGMVILWPGKGHTRHNFTAAHLELPTPVAAVAENR